MFFKKFKTIQLRLYSQIVNETQGVLVPSTLIQKLILLNFDLVHTPRFFEMTTHAISLCPLHHYLIDLAVDCR